MNDDLSTKIAMTFAITAQALFVVLLLAYCTSPMWMPLVVKTN